MENDMILPQSMPGAQEKNKVICCDFGSISIVVRLSLTPGFSRVNPAITGNKPVSTGYPCVWKPLKRLPDGLRTSSPG
jgi:hypothetical protein